MLHVTGSWRELLCTQRLKPAGGGGCQGWEMEDKVCVCVGGVTGGGAPARRGGQVVSSSHGCAYRSTGGMLRKFKGMFRAQRVEPAKSSRGEGEDMWMNSRSGLFLCQAAGHASSVNEKN